MRLLWLKHVQNTATTKRTPAGALFEESISSLLFVVHDFFMKWLTVFIGSVHDEGRGHAIFRQHSRALRGTPVEVPGLFVFMAIDLLHRHHAVATHQRDGLSCNRRV